MKSLYIPLTIFLLLTFSVSAQKSEIRDAPKCIMGSSCPTDEGYVERGVPTYKILGNDLPHLKKLKRPKLKLIFETKKINLESKKKLRKILNAHWENALSFYHKQEIDKPQNVRESRNVDSFWKKSIDKAQKKLQITKIKAPNGKRKISLSESWKIVEALNKTAINVIAQAKNVSGPYTDIKFFKKPYPNADNCRRDSGRVMLRVTFDKSAKITKVEVLETTDCLEFERDSISAAINIEFNPARTGDEPITVKKRILYKYSRY